MKNIIMLCLSLIFTLKAGTVTQTNKSFTITPGSSEYFDSGVPMASGRVVFEAKRMGVFQTQRRAGKLVIMSNGLELDVVHYYQGSSKHWRRYIVNLPRMTRSIEFWNDTGVRMKIRNVKYLRYGFGNGGSMSNGNCSELTGSLNVIIENAEIVRDLLDNGRYSATYLPLKKKSAVCLSLATINGETSEQTRNCVKELDSTLQAAKVEFQALMNIRGLEEIAQSYLYVSQFINRSLN